MKTIREHLESIADTELREAALRNWKDDGYEGIKAKSVARALAGCYFWALTPEGHSFWLAITDSYTNGNTPTYQHFKHLIR